MGQADEADGEVAQGGHDLGSVAGAQLVAVLARDDVAHPVEAVLHGPVAPGPGGDGLGPGVGHGKGADQVGHLGGPPPAAAALVDGSGAADPHYLGGAGEVDPGGGLDGLDGAPHPPPVAGVDARDGRDVLPGQLLQGPFQARPACP